MDISSIIKSKTFWFVLIMTVLFFLGFFAPFLVKETVNLEENRQLQIVERGQSYIRVHPKESNKDFVIMYKGNDQFQIQEASRGEFDGKYRK